VSPTRRDVLLGGAAAALAVAAPARAAAPGDAALLERLLAFERRLEGAYDQALREHLLDAALARRLRDQERAHIRGLELALTSMGHRPPRTAPRTLRVAAGEPFARLALKLESRTVDAYLAAIERLRNELLLIDIGSIAANQGQHVVTLRDVLGLPVLEESLVVS